MKTIIVSLFTVVLILTAQFARGDMSQPRVHLETSLGVIILELDPKAAPKTVENFLAYIRDGFYNGTIFHRVIKGFMIQGGGLSADMQRKPTSTPIRNEADNGLKNRRGTVAMARTNQPHSATSQFFINTVDNGFLDHKNKSPRGWGYCVFGKVVGGMDVVDSIEGLPTTSKGGRKDVPNSPPIIHRSFVEKE